jgi:Na+/H+-translocating membrane pyrophosphatase
MTLPSLIRIVIPAIVGLFAAVTVDTVGDPHKDPVHPALPME